jgi:hypothetical protein
MGASTTDRKPQAATVGPTAPAALPLPLIHVLWTIRSVGGVSVCSCCISSPLVPLHALQVLH